jgi:ribulose-phosphate 3-epimerase
VTRPPFEVAASLWSVPEPDRAAEARRLAAAGVRRFHWDVSDGVFTLPGGFTPAGARALAEAAGAVASETHLMVCEPARHVGDWIALCDTIAVHVESDGWADAVGLVRDAGCRPVVAVAPGTPLEQVLSLPADVGVLVMAVRPGHAGSRFDPGAMDRLDALDARPALGVDGGVDAERARQCRSHGATWVVSGSSLCSAPDQASWLRTATAPGSRAADELVLD